MKINPLWIICVITRIVIILLTRTFYKNYKNQIGLILLIMGSGFMYKGYCGSNNEIQSSKVFWHETRYLHGVLYILSSFYLYNKNIKMNSLVLSLDLIFSFMYRFMLDHF